MRFVGGVIGIGIGEIILNTRVFATLHSILDPQQLGALQESTSNIRNFSPAQIESVREAYGTAFNFQFRIAMYIAIGCLLVTLGTFVRHPIEVRDMEIIEAAERERVAALARDKAEPTDFAGITAATVGPIMENEKRLSRISQGASSKRLSQGTRESNRLSLTLPGNRLSMVIPGGP